MGGVELLLVKRNLKNLLFSDWLGAGDAGLVDEVGGKSGLLSVVEADEGTGKSTLCL